MKPYTIEVCPQGDRFIAIVVGVSPVWYRGNTINEAVTNLKRYIDQSFEKTRASSWIPRETMHNAGFTNTKNPKVIYKKSLVD